MFGQRYDVSQPPPYEQNVLVPAYNLVEAKGAMPKVQKAVEEMKSDSYAVAMGGPGVDYFSGLQAILSRNEIPLGLIDKLLALKGYTFHFKIDDSGSMAEASTLNREDAHPFMPTVTTAKLTRWQEAEDRLHIMIDLLSYVPTGPIILSHLNSSNKIILDRAGKNPKDFAEYAHKEIRALFSRSPAGSTPIADNMVQMFAQASGNTMHYLLTDGEPTGGSEEIDQIKELLFNRKSPSTNPFTFLSCSNRREDRVWMHEIEEESENRFYVAALPDYIDEKQEVLLSQGPVFPYPRGLWLLCNIAAAKNPYDLDALDQHAPLTKMTIENIFGRQYSDAEYLRYFDRHPNARRVFLPDYSLFLTKEVSFEIPSVKLFEDTLAQSLSRDMDDGNDDTEALEIANAEKVVSKYFQGGRILPKVSRDGVFGASKRNAEAYRQIPDADNSADSTCCCAIS